jgi:hypothetical protein
MTDMLLSFAAGFVGALVIIWMRNHEKIRKARRIPWNNRW